MVKRIDFDDYAEEYESLLKSQLGFFNKDRDYFSWYKVSLVSYLIGNQPDSILDYGCGIGLSLPFFRKEFSSSSIYASDLSSKSLEVCRQKHPYAKILMDDELSNYRYDLIFLSGVLHHVPVEQRPAVLRRLATLLNPNGTLAIFEHNPFNPVTRRMVSTCPFDEDAVLLTLGSEKKLVTENNLSLFKSGYCLFFPQFLKRLRPTEKMLRWLPLGGQHYILARK